LPEWLIERGIGETRFALIEHGKIIEARIEIDGLARAGSVLAARLKQVSKPVVAIAGDTEFLLPRGAPGVAEGAALNIAVTREAIPGREPWKRPLAKATDEPIRDAPPHDGPEVSLPSPNDDLREAGWDDLIDHARTGVVAFAGGELRISPTPAMTLIDVDGYLDPEELAATGAAEAAKAIRRLDIGGSIGVDLPTAGSKVARQTAAAAIDEHLPPPFERTAVNGFGFVQVVRPRVRASLVELAQDRAAFEARALLRRAAFETAGAKCLVAHPAAIAVLQSHTDWLEALTRQIGGAISLRAEASLPISGGYAERA
jgi:ribonuclease G